MYMSESVEVLISKDEIKNRITELAEIISKDYEGKKITLVCVLKGGFIFLSDLCREITVPVELDFIDVSSYGSSLESSGVIRINKDLENSITGKDVLLTEDIIDSGNTLNFLVGHIKSKLPESLRVCAMLDKRGRRAEGSINADYTGFIIPNEFVVGYGLDYDQRYRNLPYIGKLIISN